MAISVTEILGTDSLSGSRLVINDNFNVLASEINAMEVYFAPAAGTITNLQNVSTEALRVGLSTILLDINASTFDILTNVKLTGNLNMSGGGIIRNDTNPTSLNDTTAGATMTIEVGSSTAIPPYTINRCGNTDITSDLDILLNSGSIGQEIFFICTEGSGNVVIQGVSGNMVTTGALDKITLNALGESVHLLAIDNGSGIPVWFIVGGQGYGLS
uniref:Uncharacterized protein n=1 Tax=Virus NIOZ-UU157 TaxID=2763269 RepID=A0A7S9SU34_9VIRU|nr:MAG: hypothetical protein NIOZUU157_00182 [Virus NIOZ-UU157]